MTFSQAQSKGRLLRFLADNLGQEISAGTPTNNSSFIAVNSSNELVLGNVAAVAGDVFIPIDSSNAYSTSSINIGSTDTPSYTLDVAGGDINIADNQYLRIGGQAVAHYTSNQISLGSAASSKTLALNCGNSSHAPSDTDPAMFIDATGSVGIGATTAPNSVLHIRSEHNPMIKVDPGTNTTVDPALWLMDTDATAGFKLWYDNNIGATYFDNYYDDANGIMNFRTKVAGTPVTAMTIDATGSLGVGGTTTPNATIDARGLTAAIRCHDTTQDDMVTMVCNHDAGTGPSIAFGEPSDPDAEMAIGFWATNNHIDSKSNTLWVEGDPGADTELLKVQNNYNTQGDGKEIVKLIAYHSAGSHGNNEAQYIIFWDLHGSWNTLIGDIHGNGSGGIAIDYSFTGQHATVITSGSYQLGMIAESTGEIWVKSAQNIETALPKVQLASTEKSKTVYGVIANLSASYEGYLANGGLQSDEMHIAVNSIGEGFVLVTDYNGEVQNGDYIASSPIAGYGMEQDDDILRSSTVAKCTEQIDWEAVTGSIEHLGESYKAYLTPCTYHCG